jgi:putative FmdB family regulatory protein
MESCIDVVRKSKIKNRKPSLILRDLRARITSLRSFVPLWLNPKMPVFEFTCNDCGRRFSALVGVVANPKATACPRCGGVKLTKLVSRFARVRSEDDAVESLGDESAYGDVENDPKAMRRWVKDMGAAMDEDLTEDFEKAMEEESAGNTDSVI